MRALRRRREPDARHECWLIYYGDVHVGTVALRNGDPNSTDLWAWRCGFYPGSKPGEGTTGTAPSFDQAHAAFEAAWRVCKSKRTETDFQVWRDQRDWTERKYAAWTASQRAFA
jgi:hypothetical protein